jgi:hypothetical protein
VRGDVRLMVGLYPTDTPAAEIGSDNWFGDCEVDDVDALHAEIRARGGRSTPPTDQHYGMREIVVTTVDGHRIVFAQELKRPPA